MAIDEHQPEGTDCGCSPSMTCENVVVTWSVGDTHTVRVMSLEGCKAKYGSLYTIPDPDAAPAWSRTIDIPISGSPYPSRPPPFGMTHREMIEIAARMKARRGHIADNEAVRRLRQNVKQIVGSMRVN